MSTIDVDTAEDYVYDGHVAIQEVSRHRWYTRRLVVFEDGATLKGFYYLDPASEEQEGQDRFEADPVPVFPVDAKTVTTIVYERRA